MSRSETKDIIDHFREQAGYCRSLGSPFMGDLCDRMAADIEAGGVVARLVDGWPGNPRRDALSLRIAGFLHHTVLSGATPGLAETYPQADNDWSMERVWPEASAWMDQHADAARAFMRSPPQTNETRRSIALLPGFLKLAALFPGPVHILELGASAGLNQNFDRFTYRTASWTRPGDSSVVIDTEWNGPAPPVDVPLEIASRAACDQNPIDVSDPAAALRLRSYTWPDQPERLARLDAAIALARSFGTTVERADAGHWLAKQLEQRLETGLTIVFHSVFLQYPPAEVRRAIRATLERAGQSATNRRPLAWLCFEPAAFFQGPDADGVNPNDFITYLKVWPGAGEHRLLRSDGHVTRVSVL